MTQDPLFPSVAGIIRLPPTRLGDHQCFHCGSQRAHRITWRHFRSDQVETIKSLAQSECERGSDLENAEPISDQLRKSDCGLIVCRVRLKHQTRVVKRARERTRASGVIVDDRLVTEFDAGLHDDPYDARECGLETSSLERALKYRERRARSLWRCWLDVIERVTGAAGRRHLRANDVVRRSDAFLLRRRLRDAREANGALRRQTIVKRFRLASAAH